MAVNLSPVGGVAAQFFDNAGNVLTGGKLYTYAAGTTTPQIAYTTSAGSVAWSNPIILDAAGRVSGSGEIWLTDGTQYKFILRDSNDVLIATYDNIIGINSNFVNFTNEQEIQTATAGQTVFNLTTTTYSPGTNSLSVFVDGVNQYGPGAQYAFLETDADTVTFINGLHVGALVKFTTSQLNSSGAVDASQVSYDPPFVNSVPTNVEAKLAQTVSVKDFGAVGNNITDDTTAIQNAINATPAGGKLYIPTGTYLITGAGLSRTNSITIQGDGIFGAGGTALRYTGSGIAFTYGGGGGSSAGARFQDFRIVGTSAGQIGFKIYHAFNGIKLDKVYVEDFTTGDALYVEDAWDIEFSKCTFRTSYNGVNCGFGPLFGVVNSSNWISCDIINNTNIGLRLISGSSNNIIGCDFSGTNQIAIDLASGLAPSVNAGCLSNMISGCYFEGNNPPSGSEQSLIRIGANSTVSPSVIQGNVIDKPYMDFAGNYIDIINTTSTVIRDPQVGTVASGKKAIIVDSTCLRTKIEWQSRQNITDNSTTTNYITNDILSAPGDISGNFITPTRTAFFVTRSQVNNVTGNGTPYDMTQDAEVFDVTNNVSGGVFTAPKEAIYCFIANVRLSGTNGANRLTIDLITSAGTYTLLDKDDSPISANAEQYTGSQLVKLLAGGTAKVQVTVSGLGADTVDISGSFQGYIVG
jgi:hypothetical protein